MAHIYIHKYIQTGGEIGSHASHLERGSEWILAVPDEARVPRKGRDWQLFSSARLTVAWEYILSSADPSKPYYNALPPY